MKAAAALALAALIAVAAAGFSTRVEAGEQRLNGAVRGVGRCYLVSSDAFECALGGRFTGTVDGLRAAGRWTLTFRAIWGDPHVNEGSRVASACPAGSHAVAGGAMRVVFEGNDEPLWITPPRRSSVAGCASPNADRGFDVALAFPLRNRSGRLLTPTARFEVVISFSSQSKPHVDGLLLD